MKLLSFGGDRVGRLDGNEVVDITPLLGSERTGFSAMRRLIEAWPRLADSAATYDGERRPLNQVTLDAPVPDPSKVLAAPVNYRNHQGEFNLDHAIDGLGLFLKAPSSVIASGGTVRLPYSGRRFDQEGELAVVIGAPAYRLEEGQGLAHVFGYTGCLDMTMRGGEDRSTRKSFATFTPIGPWLVTPEEFGDPAGADLRCSVNGEVRQEANTADLVWSIERLVWYASWISPLEPGDVISSGTPAGVDEVLDGDVVELVIDGIGGALTVTVTDDGAVASHTNGENTGPTPPPSSRRPR